MTRSITGLLVCSVLGMATAAPRTTAQELPALKKAIFEARKSHNMKLKLLKATDLEERDRLNRDHQKQLDELHSQLIATVKRSPSAAASADALVWLFDSGGVWGRPGGHEAFRLLAEHHADRPGLRLLCATLREADDQGPQAERFLRAVRKAHDDEPTRHTATLSLAWVLTVRGDAAGPAGATARKEAEAFFEELAKLPDEADNKAMRDSAADGLYLLRHLAIGKVAPDIRGQDLGGAKMSLADYRGKVVVVTFWASWCAPCLKMLPHERELVERLKGQPFALLGVNADEKLEDARKVVADKAVSWRSFWDNGSPIVTAWRVQAFPTIYVLDRKGVIRFKNVRGEALDRAVAELLAEAAK